MTEAERQAIESAISETFIELNMFEAQFRIAPDDLETLYQAAKPIHTAALGIWSTIVDILRARKGLDQNTEERRREDAINLNELFDEKENNCGNSFDG